MVAKPRNVKVGPYNYKILWSDHAWNKYCPHGKDWHDSSGICDSKNNRILIHSSSLNLQQQKDTLIHELIHAVYRSYLLDSLKLKPKDLNAAEENIVVIATPIIYSLMKENQEIFEWLLYG